MKMTLIKGSFTPQEAEQLLSDMIAVKIKFHENKIKKEDHEESIKMREQRIIQLQNNLKDLRTFTKNHKGNLMLDADIEFTFKNA